MLIQDDPDEGTGWQFYQSLVEARHIATGAIIKLSTRSPLTSSSGARTVKRCVEKSLWILASFIQLEDAHRPVPLFRVRGDSMEVWSRFLFKYFLDKKLSFVQRANLVQLDGV